MVSIYRPLSLRDIGGLFKTRLPDSKGDTIPVAKRHSWFDHRLIATALERRKAPDKSEMEDILAKCRSLEILTLPETVALMRVTDEEGVRLILETADLVKRKVYGDRIVMSAPLHVSNYCGSECLYCAYRKSNTAIRRKQLNENELRTAALNIVRQGLTRVFLVTGQFPGADVKLLVNAVRMLYSVSEEGMSIRRVNVNVGPLEVDEYAMLREAEAGTVLIYQDTYHVPSYRTAHPAGPKSDYEKRLMAPDVAHNAGIVDAGLGLVLGLGPWQYDILGLILHATHLMEAYGTGCRSVSLHRLRPAPGCDFPAPYPVSDATFMRCIAITRLAIPYTSLIVTSKEPAGLWHRACLAGGSHLLTGSVANPYEAWQTGLDHIPMPVREDCHVDEIVRTLLDSNILPSFCTACPRVGRDGDRYTSLAAVGGLKKRCDFNSLTTCLNYLLRLAKPETREVGLKFLDARFAALPEEDRLRVSTALEEIRRGARESLV
ncbi:MAG: [FeFe] hydrogenase H-cluster radical SAM maturase HydG [Desulfovibrio sp.]|nr:[FeFe] hydrogenase H-cluster radical SAM maturase HydG [Desulfovibrio sp.]